MPMIYFYGETCSAFENHVRLFLFHPSCSSLLVFLSSLPFPLFFFSSILFPSLLTFIYTYYRISTIKYITTTSIILNSHNAHVCHVCNCRLVDGEAAVLASKRSKEKEKEREKEKEKEREKEKEKERLKDNPLYSHLKGKESKKFKSEMQPSEMSFASLSADNDIDMDATAAMKSSEEIEFAVDSVVVGDGTWL